MEPAGISLKQAIAAQQMLRQHAHLGPETFPVEEFVQMIGDELAALRKAGRSNEEIAALIGQHGIQIKAEELG